MRKPMAAKTQELVDRIKGLDFDKRQQLFGKLQQAGVNVARLPIVPALERDLRAVSYAQQRQWFLWRLDPASAAYHLPSALRLKGALHIPALQSACTALLQRHPGLRTRFVEQGEQLWQRIDAQAELPLTVEPVEAQALHGVLERLNQQPFDLEHGPLVRVNLLRLAADEHVLALNLHHIITDGWSMTLIVEDLMALYQAQVQGVALPATEQPIDYADYAAWQRQWMQAGERERQLAYWREQLGHEQPLLELPFDRPRPATPSLRGARLPVSLPTALGEGVRQLARARGVTPFVVLLASFQVLLQRYSGQHDIRVGVPVANRNRLETERLVGLFVNTQVLASRIDTQRSFAALLGQLDQQAQAAQQYQDLPFEQLVEALQPERSLNHNPLFQVLYNHLSGATEMGAVQLPGLQAEGVLLRNISAQLDLTLETQEGEQGLSASFTYATDLFDAATVECLAAHWLNLLQAVVANPEQRIAELPMQTAAEQAASLAEWNADSRDFPAQACLHQQIEAQAA
ncbi:condensation domain-containing protein, partial [Pseudomonas sp. ES1]